MRLFGMGLLSFNGDNKVFMCKHDLKYQFASQRVCTRFLETTRVHLLELIRRNMVCEKWLFWGWKEFTCFHIIVFIVCTIDEK